jgi:hypothetical protein
VICGSRQKRVNSLIIISNYMISLGASSRLHALNYSHPRLLVLEEERDQFEDGFLLICRFFKGLMSPASSAEIVWLSDKNW